MLLSELPQHIKNLQKEIEDMAKQPVVWEQNNEIGGIMSAEVKNGIPMILYRQFSEDGAAEELMHLKLELSGIPKLTYNEIHVLSKQVATILGNVLHHHIIYPILEKWGYDPRNTECEGIEKQIAKLENTDLSRLTREPALQALFAVVFVRGKLDCHSKKLTQRIENFFKKSKTAKARIIGEKIITIINKQLRGIDPDTHRDVLEKCLSILSITNTIGINKGLG